jgi:hypothetical protein
MRFSLVAWCVAAGLLALGCRSPKEPRAAEAKARTMKAEVLPPSAPPKGSARPVDAIRGRVASVREDLRFVIVDFAGGKMPVLDQQLFVYRLDHKVAEIRISGPYRGTTVAADLLQGDAKPGDLVRDR